MKIYELTRMLNAEVTVIIKDRKSGRTLYTGPASAATFNDVIKDWDFSKNHIIYI